MAVFQMPFYVIKTVSQSEKDAWIRQAKNEASKYGYRGHKIDQFFEPIKGWYPFAKYGTNPVEIIHNCIKDYDNTVGKILFRKDCFLTSYNIPTLGAPKKFKMSGQIAAFDFYSNYGNPHNALITPFLLRKGDTSVYNISNIDIDYPRTMLAESYKEYYNKIPFEAQRNILKMKLPYVGSFGGVKGMEAHVFPPAICELQGNLSGHYSMEVASKFTVIDMPKVLGTSRLPYSLFWARESYDGQGVAQYAVWISNLTGNLSKKRIDSEQALFPCFCIG